MSFVSPLCTNCPALQEIFLQEVSAAQENASYNWALQARANQKIPFGGWRIWLILAGRGFGKTRTGAETIRTWVEEGQAKRICLLGDTLEEVRRVMIEGESGLLSVYPPDLRPRYIPSQHCLIWLNGARAECYSASSYQQLRGPQFDAAWVDELAKFKYAQEAWDQLMMGLRLSHNPRVIITTTPRSIPLIHHLRTCADVHLTSGTTFDNAAHLSPFYLKTMKERYMHTPLGLQEIQGKVIDLTTQALWTPALLEQARWPVDQHLPSFERVVVAVDPAVSQREESDETGLIVAARTSNGLGMILSDLSGRFSVLEWVSKAVEAYHTYGAESLVAEVNNGGDLVASLIQTLDPTVRYKGVHATYGKRARAEPIGALYAAKKIFHTQSFPLLEEQMMTFPHQARSPDRLDALVWALTELMLTPLKRKPREHGPEVWRV